MIAIARNIWGHGDIHPFMIQIRTNDHVPKKNVVNAIIQQNKEHTHSFKVILLPIWLFC
jgi:hypothetical protein